MVAGKGDIARVAFEGSYQSFRGVIPDLDRLVVGSGQDVRLVGLRIIVDMVDTLGLMCLEGKVGVARAQTPYFHRPVKAGRCKGVCVLLVGRC